MSMRGIMDKEEYSPIEQWNRQDSERKLHLMLSKLGLQNWNNTWFSEYIWD